MPGANYMGGKRNAARARGKDATGKAQRSHFGKKRFEILRTGLSKGHASAGQTDRAVYGSTGRPEISFAHARRGQSSGRRADPDDTLPQLFATPFARTLRRSPPSSASSRSKILRGLDAENPLAQRAQANKILQIPDFLGLSTAQARSHLSQGYHTPPRSPEYHKSTYDGASNNIHADPLSPASAFGGKRGERRHPSMSRQTSPNPDSSFIPMCFDSSPPPYVHDSGYGGSWPDMHGAQISGYESAKVSFYPSSTSAPLSPISLDTRGVRGWERLVVDGHRQNSGSTLGILSSGPTLSSTAARLPGVLARARFVSDLPSLIEMPAQREVSPLPRSKSPDCHWSGPSRFYDSDDVPQASFSLSPPADVLSQPIANSFCMSSREDNPCHAGYASTDGSLYSLLDDSFDFDHYARRSSWASDDFPELQEIHLGDLLEGALFEDADPWRALDGILNLSPEPVVFRSACAVDLLGLRSSCERSGVGHLPSIASRPDTPACQSTQTAETTAKTSDNIATDVCHLAELLEPTTGEKDDGDEQVRDFHGEGGDVAPAMSQAPCLVSAIEDAYEDWTPTPLSAAAPDPDPPIEHRVHEDDRHAEAFSEPSSTPPRLEDHRPGYPIPPTPVGREACGVPGDGLLDGPSLFHDDETSDPEE